MATNKVSLAGQIVIDNVGTETLYVYSAGSASVPTGAAPRTGPTPPIPASDLGKLNKKESHKEVERRRREVINTNMEQLAAIVPETGDKSKGQVLAGAIEYIAKLRAELKQKDVELARKDKTIEDLQLEIAQLNETNAALEAELENAHDFDVDGYHDEPS
ncbi:hypothetical protein DFJ74DRAFT_710302 [Hyaloraphidium curvatum]|nr:hypothetical protein DFJ74DRAFT_710302 [Hyaloraphidium curvatum]